MDWDRHNVLSPDDSREAEEEVEGVSLTPEPRTRFGQLQQVDEVHRRRAALDALPPPDHEGFVEVRSLGFRAVRQKLAARRKPR